MSVDFDAFTPRALTATSPATVAHTPVTATPRGTIVLATHSTTPNDIITGISYGTLALSRVASITNPTNLGRSYLYFAGASIPTGTQTASVARTEATTMLHMGVLTLSGLADLEVVNSGTLRANAADPQIALAYLGRVCIALAVIFSGRQIIPTDLTELAGQTRMSEVDYGAEIDAMSRQTTPGSADTTIGWTASSDQIAMCAACIAEVATSGLPTVRSRIVNVSQAVSRAGNW